MALTFAEVINLAPISNIFGGPMWGNFNWTDTIPLPDGQRVKTAIPQRIDTVQFYATTDYGASYHPIDLGEAGLPRAASY